jgi:glycosyltransferase involved in cell wall biosynthesis
MSRVLFFLPTLSGYRDRALMLMEVSHGIDHMTLLVGRKDASVDLSRYPNLKIEEVGFRRRLRPLNMRRASKMAERLIGEERLDVVHDTFGTLLPLFRNKAKHQHTRFLTSLYVLMGWRLSHVFNDFSLIRLLSTKATANLFAGRWIERQITAASDCVVLQAPGLADHLVETTDVPRSRVRILTNSVDTDFWRPRDPSEESGVSGSELRLLYVGGLDFSRGLFVLIETMKLLAEREIPCRLTLVGGWGPFARKKAFELISTYGLKDSIEVFPFMSREELRDVYRDSDVFLCQTINEGSPRVVLEALACGLPVIASHHPGIDVLDPGGDFIAFTEYGDVEGIVEHIQDSLARPTDRENTSAKGRLEIEETFSSEAVASQYIDLYNSLASGATGTRAT